MPKLVYNLVILAALTLISFFCVDIFYEVMTNQLEQFDTQKIIAKQTPEVKRTARTSLVDYKGISERALFGEPKKSDTELKPKEIEALEPTKLNLALLGTVEGENNTGWAVIIDKTKRQQDIYHVGDNVQDGVIKKIIRNKVILRVGEKDEVLTIEEGSREARGAPVPQSTDIRPSARGLERTITLRRTDIDESLQDINKILTEARIRPHFNRESMPDGLIITGIRGNSIFRRMGLRNGDIIQGVDGRPIASPDDIVSMYSDFKSASNVAIQILRRGREQTLSYQFR